MMDDSANHLDPLNSARSFALAVCLGLVFWSLVGLCFLSARLIMRNEEKPSNLEKLRRTLFQGEGEDVFLDAGDVYIDAPEFNAFSEELMKWWERNREWLLPWVVPKQAVFQVDVIGGVLTESKYYNNTELTFTFSRQDVGRYQISPAAAWAGSMTVQVQSISSTATIINVVNWGPESILIRRYDASGAYADGDWFVVLTVWE